VAPVGSFFFFQAEDGIRDFHVTGVQTCALPISIEIRQDSYAVLGLMAGYRAGNGWEATLNLDNLTDEKYIASLYWEQGYYATPRSEERRVGKEGRSRRSPDREERERPAQRGGIA